MEKKKNKKAGLCGENPHPPKNREAKKQTASVLSGIHYQDSRGMLQINPSDAFSVLLTFSPSPKRHVVCQGAFIKLDQRENNVKTHGSPQRHADRLSQRRCLLLLSAGAAAAAAAHSIPPWRAALPSLPAQAGIKRGKHAFRRGSAQMQCVIVKPPTAYSSHQRVALDTAARQSIGGEKISICRVVDNLVSSRMRLLTKLQGAHAEPWLGPDISLRWTIINPQRSKTSMTVLKKAPGHLWLSQVGISRSSLMVQSEHELRSVDSFTSPKGSRRFVSL